MTETASGRLEATPRSQTFGWQALDSARDQRFTGALVVDVGEEIRLFFDLGTLYLAERATDPTLSDRLQAVGVVTADDLAMGTVEVGGVVHLGRLFDRAPAVDRDRVVTAIELMNDEVVGSIAGLEVLAAEALPYRHHPSGIQRWTDDLDRTDETDEIDRTDPSDGAFAAPSVAGPALPLPPPVAAATSLPAPAIPGPAAAGPSDLEAGHGPGALPVLPPAAASTVAPPAVVAAGPSPSATDDAPENTPSSVAADPVDADPIDGGRPALAVAPLADAITSPSSTPSLEPDAGDLPTSDPSPPVPVAPSSAPVDPAPSAILAAPGTTPSTGPAEPATDGQTTDGPTDVGRPALAVVPPAAPPSTTSLGPAAGDLPTSDWSSPTPVADIPIGPAAAADAVIAWDEPDALDEADALDAPSALGEPGETGGEAPSGEAPSIATPVRPRDVPASPTDSTAGPGPAADASPSRPPRPEGMPNLPTGAERRRRRDLAISSDWTAALGIEQVADIDDAADTDADIEIEAVVEAVVDAVVEPAASIGGDHHDGPDDAPGLEPSIQIVWPSGDVDPRTAADAPAPRPRAVDRPTPGGSARLAVGRNQPVDGRTADEPAPATALSEAVVFEIDWSLGATSPPVRPEDETAAADAADVLDDVMHAVRRTVAACETRVARSQDTPRAEPLGSLARLGGVMPAQTGHSVFDDVMAPSFAVPAGQPVAGEDRSGALKRLIGSLKRP